MFKFLWELLSECISKYNICPEMLDFFVQSNVDKSIETLEDLNEILWSGGFELMVGL